MLMANQYNFSSVIEYMDDLWFHQIILFPELPMSLFSSSNNNNKSINAPISEQEEEESMLVLLSSLETEPSSSSVQSPVINLQLVKRMGSEEEEDGEKGEIDYEQCSNSSSPSSPQSSFHTETLRSNLKFNKEEKNKREGGGVLVRRSMRSSKKKKKMGLGLGLGQRSMSWDQRRRSLLWDLEVEEVKGFMDLGFRFEKEQLNRELVNVLPGLQRFSSTTSTSTSTTSTNTDDDELKESNGELVDDEDEEEGDGAEFVVRPYLSEAWLIKRPDSPLLNLRIPKSVSTPPADMKEHIRCWARTVASEILLG